MGSDERIARESEAKTVEPSSKIIVNKADLLDDTKMAHELNSFITDVEKSLTSKIRNASTLSVDIRTVDIR